MLLSATEQCKFDKIGVWTLKSLRQRLVHIECTLYSVCTLYIELHEHVQRTTNPNTPKILNRQQIRVRLSTVVVLYTHFGSLVRSFCTIDCNMQYFVMEFRYWINVLKYKHLDIQTQTYHPDRHQSNRKELSILCKYTRHSHYLCSSLIH